MRLGRAPLIVRAPGGPASSRVVEDQEVRGRDSPAFPGEPGSTGEDDVGLEGVANDLVDQYAADTGPEDRVEFAREGFAGMKTGFDALR